MKEIITTNAGEGFLNLSFVKEIRVLINNKQRECISIHDISPFLAKKKYFSIEKQTRTKILCSSISYSKLSQLFFEYKLNYTETIKKLYKKLDVLQKKEKHRRKGINIIRRDINLLKYNRKGGSIFPLEDFLCLLKINKCPKRYYNKTNEEHNAIFCDKEDGEIVLDIDILTINTRAISYIENLKDIGRIVLSTEQQAMLSAIKDLASVKSETTFEEYIDDWAGKLLKRGIHGI